LKTQKITQNALTGPAHRPGEKGGRAGIGAVLSQINLFF
jgi:hypothetical protein